jgi:RND family efflux transporter MFP subunit
LDIQPLKIDRESTERRRRPGRRPRWIKPVAALFILGSLLWLFRAPILGFVDNVRLPEVKTVRVAKRSQVAAATLTGTSANGYIVAKTRAALSADAPGRIVQLNVEEGSVVKKNDIVARLYSDEYAAALRRAEADLQVAQATTERSGAETRVASDDLARLQSLQSGAESDLSQQKAALALAQLASDRAEKLLADGVGTVERRDQTKADLDVAKARAASAESQIETAKRSVTQAESRVLVSKSMEKEALARFESFKAMRDQAKATLDKTEVRAPFDGIVVLKDAEVGEVVSPNVQGGTNARGSVVTMVDFASLEVEAEVPETSLAAVVIGRPARIYLDAFPEKPYSGRVDRIWPTANRTKATVEVRVAFLERDDKLRPEMGVRVVFLEDSAEAAAPSVEEKAVLVIPAEAVVKVKGETAVFVLERDAVRLQKIVLGGERAGKVVVESGLSEGDEIVIAPPPTLKDEDRVRPTRGS